MKDTASVKKDDWFVYLERRQSPFLMGAFIKPFKDLFEQKIGRGFEKQLHVIHGENCYYIRSQEEDRLIKNILSEFILDPKNQSTLRDWQNSGLELNRWADKEIESYRNVSDKDLGDITRYEQFFDNFSLLLLYSCIIPYWAMLVADEILETTRDVNKRNWATQVIKLFKPLRGDTRYPQVIDGVMKKYWQHVSKTTGQPMEIIQYLLPHEFSQTLSEPRFIDSVKDVERRISCVFGILPDKELFFDFSKETIENLLPKPKTAINEIRGTIAHPGFVKGVAKIVNTLSDMDKVNQGDIIVSINTSPSIMLALKKAGGIVTDEGGIMCHAAIVSRELNIPCIIGTKIATKTFKDSDHLQLDANKGVVKRID